MKSVSQDMSKTKIANQKYPLKTFDTIPMLKPYTPLLDGVDSPADLKKMSTAQLQQLADELGITREATSRVLKQMEKENLLILSRNKIELL